nr:uncharacterized protein K02A2.6-like [Quercus suber]
MPKIDQLVDATVGHPRMSFLDPFQGYHQIPLALDDQEKTAFVTPIGNYHYKVMPFGLKNSGSTYQRMMTRMFEPQLGRNIEIYIDDMVVKSKIITEHIKDLESTFEVLRKYKLHPNASKCSFGVGSGKFLGYMVTHRGIEVNPDQIKAINNLRAPRNPKEVQRLTGMMAALNRFISRNSNAHADSLATLATSSAQGLPRVILVEELQELAEARAEAVRVHQIRAEPSWMDPIINFLRHDVLPKEKGEADKVRRKTTRFWLSEDQRLYKRSYPGPYLLCVHPEAAELLLEELHEGIYGSHTGGRSLAHRAITQGYWWPNMQNETQEYVKKCDQCQRFASNIHQPGGTLNPLFIPWPFAQWGLDIVGSFPKAAGNKKYLLVGTDYFTKWVEAEALANIRDVDIQKFVRKNIITRFGVPHTLISNNGLQFDSKAFRSYCSELGITNRYSTPAYPQGNDQDEAVNKVIVNGLKKRLDDAKGKWIEELPHVL